MGDELGMLDVVDSLRVVDVTDSLGRIDLGETMVSRVVLTVGDEVSV
jgi:hypothetical protein